MLLLVLLGLEMLLLLLLLLLLLKLKLILLLVGDLVVWMQSLSNGFLLLLPKTLASVHCLLLLLLLLLLQRLGHGGLRYPQLQFVLGRLLDGLGEVRVVSRGRSEGSAWGACCGGNHYSLTVSVHGDHGTMSQRQEHHRA